MKTTKKDFILFQEQFLYWTQKMGLINWQYYFQHCECETKGCAEVVRDVENKIATVRLAPDWGEMPVTHRELCKTAFHEADEVRYARIAMLMYTFYSEKVLLEETHSLIRLDENMIFEPYYTEQFGE